MREASNDVTNQDTLSMIWKWCDLNGRSSKEMTKIGSYENIKNLLILTCISVFLIQIFQKLASTQPSVIKTDPTQLDSFQKPVDDEKMADAKDPNYRSFKGIGNEIFIKPSKCTKSILKDMYII